MTRPEIIRADTIDLQDRDAPSAKNHPRQPQAQSSQPASGSLAPHQAETIREVAAESAEENSRSPRLSWSAGMESGGIQHYSEDLAAGASGSVDSASSGRSKMQQQDALAIAQNGGNELLDDDLDPDGEDDDDMDKISSSPSIDDERDDLLVPYSTPEDGDDDDDSCAYQFDPRYCDSGWSSECLQDTEDIDFEFVYALHTFVATVEGQANATKGDTMVLLDDSNSYWWLVRVVKDSSIGYLPAEHIETPTERLARLNKHRNIDLSATMLGDQMEKTKNPIKSAMKRRKTKTVAFAAPTFHDYSDIDYSTEEEDPEMDYYIRQQQVHQQQEQEQQQQEQQKDQQQAQRNQPQQQEQLQQPMATAQPANEDEPNRVEAARSRPQKDVKAVELRTEEADDDVAMGGRTSEDIFEASKSVTPGPTRTKDGTVRDSFFKDDTVETKKITLTPNLLRDDGGPRTSSDSKEAKQRPSLDKLEKDGSLGKDEKKKKDKKEKEKKPSAIRSFFSRGGKKKSIDEDDDQYLAKRSMDAISESNGNDSEEVDESQSSDKTTGPTRNPSKLQKQPRTEPSPTRKPSSASHETSIDSYTETRTNNVANVPPATMRIVEADVQDGRDAVASKNAIVSLDSSKGPMSKREPKSSASKVMPSRMQTQESKPQKAPRPKTGPELDVTTSAGEDAAVQELARPGSPFSDSGAAKGPMARQMKTPTFQDSTPNTQVGTLARENLTESPIQPSAETQSNPPALMGDTSSQEDQSSPISSPSPELDGDEEIGRRHRKDDSVTTSTSTASAAWNDASLRAYFDSGTEIRDMLTLIYDKTDVAPVGPDHPIAGSLFREQNAKLAEITTQLDNMLGDWLARKQRLRSTA